jgi:hypothetical protein
VVDVPTELALERLVEQRGFTRTTPRPGSAAQPSREARREGADFVIDNLGDRAHLRRPRSTGSGRRVWRGALPAGQDRINGAVPRPTDDPLRSPSPRRYCAYLPGTIRIMCYTPPAFEVVSPFRPAGDQPEAIAGLVAEGLERGDRYQTLLGITGSGQDGHHRLDRSRRSSAPR